MHASNHNMKMSTILTVQQVVSQLETNFPDDIFTRKAEALRIASEAKKNNPEIARYVQFYADKLHDQIVSNPAAQWMR